ncbi:hypothetical protein [Terrarubrum flagellatum]|uniref:hypothetical protein n=1 Tax=Terrirubrum flagellatum TaxID=2895980 RepID=UPI0031456019
MLQDDKLQFQSAHARYFGVFDEEELALMSGAMRVSESILSQSGDISGDETRLQEQRDLLSRIVIDVFGEGERDMKSAVDKSVARFMTLLPASLRQP